MPTLLDLIEKYVQATQALGGVKPSPASPLAGTRTLEVLHEFLTEDVRTWQDESPAQVAIDFVAGMTDSFFVTAFNELFFPAGVG